MNELRFKTERREYTFWQRISIWWRNVLQAVKDLPPKEWFEYIELNPGEPGYEDAPFSCVTDPNPVRFKIENGEYVQVNPETASCESNPNWYTPKT